MTARIIPSPSKSWLRKSWPSSATSSLRSGPRDWLELYTRRRHDTRLKGHTTNDTNQGWVGSKQLLIGPDVAHAMHVVQLCTRCNTASSQENTSAECGTVRYLRDNVPCRVGVRPWLNLTQTTVNISQRQQVTCSHACHHATMPKLSADGTNTVFDWIACLTSVFDWIACLTSNRHGLVITRRRQSANTNVR